MSAARMLRTVSDDYLQGAIAQLARSGDWPRRLSELRDEVARRKTFRRKAG